MVLNIQNESRGVIFTRPGLFPEDGSEMSVSTVKFHIKEGNVIFARDFELNGVCSEVCVGKTLNCITNCDPTDSECISVCLRAEVICINGELRAHLICQT